MPNSYLVRVLYLAVATAGAAPLANAGGFQHPSNGGFGYGASSANTSVKAKSAYIDYESGTFSNAEVKSLYGGKIVEGTANAGGSSSFFSIGNVNYQSQTKAKSKVYAKAGKVLAKSRAHTYTTIFVGGKAQVVSTEISRAMARFTPLGTIAESDAQVNTSAVTNGYIGVSTGVNTSATVKTIN